jgi:hypothetical protein
MGALRGLDLEGLTIEALTLDRLESSTRSFSQPPEQVSGVDSALDIAAFMHCV